jgi:hypothetical protein
LFLRLLRQPDERLRAAFGGLLAGYAQLRPDDGWRLTLAVLADAKRPFPERYAALGAVRFFHRSQPASSRPRVLQALTAVLRQSDMADLAVEDLRRWQLWDLTPEVLALYGARGYDAPIARRAIVRYGLYCPRPEAQQFVARLRQTDPELVSDVEESLRYEQAPPAGPGGR